MVRQKVRLAHIDLKDSNMNLLICDDDKTTVQKISNLIRAQCLIKGNFPTIVESTCPESVDPTKEFDIAFLDIDMPHMSGLELARKLHALHPNLIIIFITNFIQYAPEGYEVGAFRYLMKEQIPEKLNHYFSLAVEEFAKHRRIITIQINGEHIDILVSNILYMESQGRLIIIHLINDSRSLYQFYGNMTNLEQKFEVLGFLRVHKSYLVNMAYIETFQCKKLTLKGNLLIPSSERKYSNLKQRYLKWEAENKWSIC